MFESFAAFLVTIFASVGGLFGGDPNTGAFGDPFLSLQTGSSPTAGDVLQTDGTDSTWVATSTLGISGGSSAFTSLTDVDVSALNAGDVFYVNGAGDIVDLALGSSGQVLTATSSAVFWSTPSGTGDVTAASNFSADNRVIRSDGTGKGVQASGLTLDDSDNLSGIVNLTVTGTSSLATTTIADLTVTNDFTADFATALAANGANCSSGNAPLGVDASGAVESCFDVWTEAENTSAAYLQNIVEDTTPQLSATLDTQGNDIDLQGTGDIILDADGDTKINGNTDDLILFTVGGQALLRFTGATPYDSGLFNVYGAAFEDDNNLITTNDTHFLFKTQGTLAGTQATLATFIATSTITGTNASVVDIHAQSTGSDTDTSALRIEQETDGAFLIIGQDAGENNVFTVNENGQIHSSTLTAGQPVATDGSKNLVSTSTINENFIDSAIARDSELHDAVTLAGEDFLSLATQQITANAINPDNLAAVDFGDFSCNGTVCTLDANTVGTSEIDLSIAPTWTGQHTFSATTTLATTTLPSLLGLIAVDDTSEGTIEDAIDTLANLTSVQGRTVTLADAGADAIFGWDDTASAYENLTASEALAIIGGAANDFDGNGDVTVGSAEITNGAIVNDDVNASAAIAYSKLNLAASLIETDLDADVAPVDGDFLQYDSTGTNFTWRSGSETLGDIGAQAQDAVLDDLAALTVVADNEFIVGTGAGTYGHESGATAVTSLENGAINVLLETEIDASSELAALMDDETGSGALVFGTSPVFTTQIDIGSAGVRISDDGDGALTFLGLGNGSDENLILNFDDVANTVDITSSTGVTLVDFNALGLTSTGNVDFGGANFVEIPNGTNPTANDPGEIAHDTTVNQLILDDRAIPTTDIPLFGFQVASTSHTFASGTAVSLPQQMHGYSVTGILCYVTSGTSKVINLFGEALTCDSDGAEDDGTIGTPNISPKAATATVTMGAVSGSVDALNVSIFGEWTRQ